MQNNARKLCRGSYIFKDETGNWHPCLQSKDGYLWRTVKTKRGEKRLCLNVKMPVFDSEGAKFSIVRKNEPREMLIVASEESSKQAES